MLYEVITTIEHIIPQNPHLSADWVSTLGSDWEEIQKKYLHTIGNLTLTAYNSEMSDSPFADKLTMDGGFQQSALRLNKYVVTQITWGEPQVNERAAHRITSYNVCYTKLLRSG